MSVGAASKRGKVDRKPCRRCGHLFRTDKAQCPSCGMWNFASAPEAATKTGTILFSSPETKPIKKIVTGIADSLFSQRMINGVMTTGIVTTSVSLIGGDPGVGKSTFCLQLVSAIAAVQKREALYIGLEESQDETIDRARRLNLPNLDMLRLYPIGCDLPIDAVLDEFKPCAVIVDSIVKLSGGDHQNAVIICEGLKKAAIRLDAPFFVIDHVTKEQALAGLQALQHEVDLTALFYSVPDPNRSKKFWVREIVSFKNRFGPAPETAAFDMTETGLVARPITELESDDVGEEEEGD